MTLTHLPAHPQPKATLHPSCATCGSDTVKVDAWATWDADHGNWTLDALFDHALCTHCAAPTTLIWSTPGTEAPNP